MTHISSQEHEILAACKESQPFWFKALMRAASIMPARRAKYSGKKTHPYTNFIIMAKLLGVPVQQVFRFYLAIKFARHIMDTGDFEDEGAIDSDRDMANYAMLSAGWRLMTQEERWAAEVESGWVELDLAKKFQEAMDESLRESD